MTEYICEHGCKFTKDYMDAAVIQIYGPDERAYCAFCEFKKPVNASFSKGFEQMPVLTEFCLGMTVDVYEETKKRIEELKKKQEAEA